MEYIIKAPCGEFKGIDGKKEGTLSFKGIRYATSSRFEYSKEITQYEGVYDASKYGHCSYQPRSFYNEEENKKKYFYYNEFRKGEEYTYSEDSLFLNIFTNKDMNDNTNAPVIVYIHGGGFKGGCGHEKHFDEPVWPLKGVIGVTFNYRLGPLGFMSLEELKELDGHCSNYGLYDQIEALKWVKHNIKAFGGNPNNITIMGQSAGAMSVQQLCLSPLTDGLFHKAVMLSGGGVSKILSTPKASKYYEFNKKIMELCNCSNIEEFKKVPVEVLFNAFEEARKVTKGIMMPSCPLIDDELIIGSGVDLLKEGKYKKIPYLIGSTSEDMMAPFIQSMAQKWCEEQEIDAYCFMFNHQLPGDTNGAWHSSDLWYFFGTLDNSWRPMTDYDYELSNQMVDYLVNFVTNGNPNNEILPKWLSTNKKQKKVMHFGNNITMMKKVNRFKLWYNLFFNKAVGE